MTVIYRGRPAGAVDYIARALAKRQQTGVTQITTGFGLVPAVIESTGVIAADPNSIRELATFLNPPTLDDEVVVHYVMPFDGVIAADLANWNISFTGTNPAASLVYTVKAATVAVGTITIATDGTITKATTDNADVDIDSEDLLEVVASDSAEVASATTLVAIRITIVKRTV